MHTLEKVQLIFELKKAIEARIAEKMPLKKIALIKTVQDLREKLGLTATKVVEAGPNEINVDELSKDLTSYQQEGDKNLAKAVERWLKTNVQGKVITTVDGKKVRFNYKSSTKHLTFDAKRSDLAAKAITHIVDVFKTGEFKGRESLYKERNDGFIAFHAYEKRLEIDGYLLLVEAKAGEKENGELETLSDLVAYHQKIKEKVASSAFSIVETSNSASQEPNLNKSNFKRNDIPTIDSVQAGNRQDALLTILEITDLDGNPVSLDDEPVLPTPSIHSNFNILKQNPEFFGYNGANGEKSTKGSRQKANNNAYAIIKLIQEGHLSLDDVTDEQRLILSQYSGNGAGMKNGKGLVGSQYEYYTPKAVAEGMWTLLNEMGFTGGKVLDPCAGTGIFSLNAPENALMHSIELSDESSVVNQAIFHQDPNKTCEQSAFEAVAVATPDESYDAVISNVPFGSNADRGEHKFKDTAYQDLDLDSYFILRSLDKLKPNGLAVFMASTRFMTGVSHEKIRRLASLKGEFMGAYRLPNKLFETAGADVVTDVIVFKKHSRLNQELISDLMKGKAEVLTQANVLWTPFIEGRYFKEHPKYVLGTETVGKGRYGEVVKIINDQSISHIATLLRRFEGSRIDWALINGEEVADIQYQNGDIVSFAGRQKVYQNGLFVDSVAEPHQANSAEKLSLALGQYKNALQVVEEKLDFAHFIQLQQQAIALSLPLTQLSEFAKGLLALLKNNTLDAEQLTHYVACMALLELRQAQAKDEDFLTLYPQLSSILKRLTLGGKRAAPTFFDNELATQYKFLKNGGVFDKKANDFTAYWKGIQAQSSEKIDHTLSPIQQYEKLLYEKGASFSLKDGGISKEVFAQHFPDVDLDKDLDWCLSLDGKNVIAADDYYSGNYAQFKDAHEEAINQIDDEVLKRKLIQQMQKAEVRLLKADVYKMDFDISSNFIELKDKVVFLNSAVANGRGEFLLNADGKIEFKPNAGAKYQSDLDKVLKRLAIFVNTGSFSSGQKDEGVKIRFLKMLKEEINKANAQFSTWVKINPKFMKEIDQKVNNEQALVFKSIENGEPIAIEGINPVITPRPHQAAYIRQQTRHMGGICGFDVGLGKTLTALLAVQHLQSIGAKNKTLFVVPNTTLTNWRKEAKHAYTEEVFNRCLFVGLRENQGTLKLQSAKVGEDLIAITENKHDKIYMTMEAFTSILLQDKTLEAYLNMLSNTDPALAESDKAADEETRKGKVAKFIRDLKGTMKGAEFLEKMGIDSLVIDEAHNFKNAKSAKWGGRVKWLSLAPASSRGKNAMVKTWYIRQKSGEKNDGVLCLTATPITNSPLEIFSMMALTIGEEKVNQLTGSNGADQFLEMFCDIEYREEKNAVGNDVNTEIFAGLKNISVLRKLLHSVATMKSADDLPNGRAYIPEEQEIAQSVKLFPETKQAIEKAKSAYLIAKEATKPNPKLFAEDLELLEKIKTQTGESNEILAHPFNFINKVSKILLDRDLAGNISRYVFDQEQKELAEQAVTQFNKLNIKEERTNLIGFERNQILSSRFAEVRGSEDEESALDTVEIFEIAVNARLEHDQIILTSTDFNTQSKFLAITQKLGLDLNVQISAKMAALLENVNLERSNPKAKGGIAKQIIFCDMLGSHHKLKILLAKQAGISAAKIAIINAQAIKDQAEIQDIQDGFNADEDDNRYEIIIANKKAEVGINLQKGTQAIHHLTVGWTPDSLQQRNGRGVRQGNYLAELDLKVNVYHYDAEGSFDEYKRHLVNGKDSWISALTSNTVSTERIKIGQLALSNKEQEELANAVGDSEALANIQERIAERNKQAQLNASRDRLRKKALSTSVLKRELKAVDNFRDYLFGIFESIIFSLNDIHQEISTLNGLKNELSFHQGKENPPKTVIEKLKKRLERQEQTINELWKTVYQDNKRYVQGEMPETPVFNEDEWEQLERKFGRVNPYNKATVVQGEIVAKHKEQVENSAIYGEWQEQKQAMEKAVEESERELTSLAKDAEFDEERLALMQSDSTFFVENTPLMKGDFIEINTNTWAVITKTFKPYYGDVKVEYRPCWYSGNEQEAFLGHENSIDPIREKITNVVLGRADKAEAFYQLLASSDGVKEYQGYITWGDIIPEVKKYMTDEKQGLIEADIKRTRLNNVEETGLNILLSVDDMKRFEEKAPRIYQDLVKTYEEAGVIYKEDNVYLAPYCHYHLGELIGPQEKASALVKFYVTNGNTLTEDVPFSVMLARRALFSLSTPTFNAKFVDKLNNIFEQNKAVKDITALSELLRERAAELIHLSGLATVEFARKHIFFDGLFTTGSLANGNEKNLFYVLAKRIDELLTQQAQENNLAEDEDLNLINEVQQEELATTNTALEDQFYVITGSETFKFNKNIGFKAFVGKENAAFSGKKSRPSADDKAFWARFDPQTLAKLPEKVWIVDRTQWDKAYNARKDEIEDMYYIHIQPLKI